MANSKFQLALAGSAKKARFGRYAEDITYTADGTPVDDIRGVWHHRGSGVADGEHGDLQTDEGTLVILRDAADVDHKGVANPVAYKDEVIVDGITYTVTAVLVQDTVFSELRCEVADYETVRGETLYSD